MSGLARFMALILLVGFGFAVAHHLSSGRECTVQGAQRVFASPGGREYADKLPDNARVRHFGPIERKEGRAWADVRWHPADAPGAPRATDRGYIEYRKGVLVCAEPGPALP